MFDFFYLPACHTCGGILLAWRRDTWSASSPNCRDYSLTAKVTHVASGEDWWITSVYGPQADQEKILFLDEIRAITRIMGCFRRCIDDSELIELHLHGCLFTWSSERDSPTLERLDRVFVSEDWSMAFPDHGLSALAIECSDHAPLLLQTDCALPHFKRFRFENFWIRCDGYLETVEAAWNAPLPWSHVDAFRVLDYKLRATARALSS